MDSASPPIAVVSVSGGKDSSATAILALDRYGHERCRFVMADTGHEHEETVRYVTEYLPKRLNIKIDVVKADFSDRIAGKRKYIAEKWSSKGVPDDMISRALATLRPTGIPFIDLCLWKGRFPSRMAQFCTQELKRYPLESYMMGLSDEIGCRLSDLESWQGVRRDESAARRDALDREQAAEGWWIERPIAGWNAAQVFDLLAERKVDPNPLYRQGAKRVGCMPCVNCGKDELLIISQRWPRYIDIVREWESLVSAVSKKGFSSFFHGDEDFDGLSDAEIFGRLKIDERVRWAQTSRGGKQYDLDRFMPPSACSSVYGLCE